MMNGNVKKSYPVCLHGQYWLDINFRVELVIEDVLITFTLKKEEKNCPRLDNNLMLNYANLITCILNKYLKIKKNYEKQKEIVVRIA